MVWTVYLVRPGVEAVLDNGLSVTRLGNGEGIRQQLAMLFPDLDTLDPSWLRLDGGSYYMEFDLGNKAEVQSISLHIRGSREALVVIEKVCRWFQWDAYDVQTGAFLYTNNKEQEQTGSYGEIQAVREVSVETQAPAQEKKKSWWGWLLGFLILGLGKFKTIAFALFSVLKLGKFAGTGLSMVLMIVSYTFFYGWKYALGIVVLIFIHEMGHVYFSKLKKVEVSLPLFIPFVGAFIRLKEEPKDAKTDAFIAVGGPLFGVIGAFICMGLAFAYESKLMAALAYFGFFITVFNLVPAYPLDGGRIVTSLSPAFWVVGIVLLGALSFYYFNPMVILVLLLAIGRAWKAWKNRHEEAAYFQVETSFRWKMGASYFGLLGVSSFFVYWLHSLLQTQG